MIHSHSDPLMRKNLVIKFMDLPTQTVKLDSLSFLLPPPPKQKTYSLLKVGKNNGGSA